MITINVVLDKIIMDREGLWKITFEAPDSEREKMRELSEHTQKSLILHIVPPRRDEIIGSKLEIN